MLRAGKARGPRESGSITVSGVVMTTPFALSMANHVCLLCKRHRGAFRTTRPVVCQYASEPLCQARCSRPCRLDSADPTGTRVSCRRQTRRSLRRSRKLSLQRRTRTLSNRRSTGWIVRGHYDSQLNAELAHGNSSAIGMQKSWAESLPKGAPREAPKLDPVYSRPTTLRGQVRDTRFQFCAPLAPHGLAPYSVLGQLLGSPTPVGPVGAIVPAAAGRIIHVFIAREHAYRDVSRCYVQDLRDRRGRVLRSDLRHSDKRTRRVEAGLSAGHMAVARAPPLLTA